MKVAGMDIDVNGRLLRIASLHADGYEFLEDPESLIAALRTAGPRIDLFTFTQGLADPSPKFSYPMEWDNFAALPITTFEDWWKNQLGFKGRNKAKQAEKKGVIVRETPFDDELVRGIWQIYNECPVRQGRPFSHYGKSVETVYKEEATLPDTSIFIGAYLESSLVGFVKLVHDETRTQAGLMNIVAMIRHRDKAVANALVAQAVKSCAERGFPYLVYSSFAYGKKEKDSITDFKERNGFRRIDVPRYYVPLTRRGATALRLGLHHKLIDRLPEPLTARLRELRSAWYNRKLKLVTEAL